MLKSIMGSGKTKVLIDFLRQSINNKLSTLVLSMRRTYANSIETDLNSIDPNVIFANYLDENLPNKLNFSNCILGAESMNRVDEADDFNTLVMDECTSFLKQMYSPFHSENLFHHRELLEKFIKKAKYIIFMDADIDEKIIKYVNRIIPNTPINLNINTKLPNNKVIYYEKHEYEMFELIKEHLNNGKNIQIVTGTAKKGKILYAYLLSLGINEDDIIFHYGDGDDLTSIIRNIGVNWLKYKILIYTSIVGPGLDFNILDHFSYRFEFGNYSTNTVREFIQMTNRVRHLKENTVYFCHNSCNGTKSVDKYQLLKQLNNYIITSKRLNKTIFTTSDLMSQDEVYYDQITRLMKSKTIRTLDTNNIYVDLYLDFLVETNESFNNFNGVYKNIILNKGFTIIDKCEGDKTKMQNLKDYIKYVNTELEKNILVKISTISNILSARLYEEFMERIITNTTTESDKLSSKLFNLKQQFIDFNMVDNNRDFELLNYNLKNYTKIFYYRCLIQMSEVDWLETDLTDYNPNVFGKKSKAVILYIVKFFCINLGFKNCRDFETIIHDKDILKMHPFIKNNFWDIKKLMSLRTKRIPDNYTTIKSFICSILQLVGLNFRRDKSNSENDYDLKLELHDDMFKQSIELYRPFKTIQLNNIDILYKEFNI